MLCQAIPAYIVDPHNVWIIISPIAIGGLSELRASAPIYFYYAMRAANTELLRANPNEVGFLPGFYSPISPFSYELLRLRVVSSHSRLGFFLAEFVWIIGPMSSRVVVRGGKRSMMKVPRGPLINISRDGNYIGCISRAAAPFDAWLKTALNPLVPEL